MYGSEPTELKLESLGSDGIAGWGQDSDPKVAVFPIALCATPYGFPYGAFMSRFDMGLRRSVGAMLKVEWERGCCGMAFCSGIFEDACASSSGWKGMLNDAITLDMSIGSYWTRLILRWSRLSCCPGPGMLAIADDIIGLLGPEQTNLVQSPSTVRL